MRSIGTVETVVIVGEAVDAGVVKLVQQLPSALLYHLAQLLHPSQYTHSSLYYILERLW